LYYEVELFEDVGGRAGGDSFPTTTIITKNRIFIPVPDNLEEFFRLTDNKKSTKFYVRFDNL
jgi:molecular chaperone HtpG